MMDAVLVEHFHAAHRQRRSGMLRIVMAGRTVSFSFTMGDPVAVDFGVDKDQLLADALLAYHRITPEFHQAALAVCRSGHAPVAETVRRHQAASDEELARTTQAMVEDGLCRVFADRNQGVTFEDGVAPDSLDFTARAFRLRIEAEVLLRTTTQRVDEMRSLVASDPSFSAVYALAESAASGELAPAEKLALNAIDGRRPVSELAQACRDSDLGMARTLAGLAAKGVVRRVQARATETLVDSRIQRAAGTAPSAVGTAPSGGFVPVRRMAEDRPLVPMRTLLMLAVLVLVVAVGWLVLDYDRKRRELEELNGRIAELVGKSDWPGARILIEEAAGRAGKDLEARRQVDLMRQSVDRALRSEGEQIVELAVAGDLVPARRRLALLPPGPESEAVRQEVVRAERAFEERSRALVARTDELLRRGDIAGAVAVVQGEPGQPVPRGAATREREAAREFLDRWRAARLDEAVPAGAPIKVRRQALARLAQAAPSDGQTAMAARLGQAIDLQVVQVREALARLAARLDEGLVDEAAVELERLRLVEIALGSELDQPLAGLRQGLETRRGALASFQRRAGAVLRDPGQAADLPSAIQAGVELQARCAGSAREALDETIAALREVAGLGDDLSPAARADALRGLLDRRRLPEAVSKAVAERIERVRRSEADAVAGLDAARSARRDGDLERAAAGLRRILASADLRRSEVRRQAETELAEVTAATVRRAELSKELERVVAAGDVAAAGAISREMGLPYLPLVVDSEPRGGVVSRKGVEGDAGPAPRMFGIPAAERVDADFVVSMPGYRDQVVRGADAESGWRLVARLERQALAQADAGMVLTSRPVVVGDRVLAASRLGAVLIAADGALVRLPFAAAAVDAPVYAAGASDGRGGLLFASRDRTGILVSEGVARRQWLPSASDEQPVVHVSELMLGRVVVVVAGRDGVLRAGHAGPGSRQEPVWESPSGAPFAAAPLAAGDRVLSVRRDGTLESVGIEDGLGRRTQRLGAAVVSAWPVAGGFAGITGTESWTWTGGALSRSPLPFPVSVGGERAALSPAGRVLVEEGGRWTEVGRCEGAPAAAVTAWRGHAVVPLGRQLTVYGPRGFTVRSAAEFLPGVALGERLVLIDQAGGVRIFGP